MLGVWGPRRVPVPTRESPRGPALPPAHHGALDPGSTWSLMPGTSCLYFEQLYRTELRIRPLLRSTPGAARAPRHCWNATRANAGRRVRPWGDVSSREPNAGSGPASGSLRRLLRFKALKRSPALKAPTRGGISAPSCPPPIRPRRGLNPSPGPEMQGQRRGAGQLGARSERGI